MSRRSIIQSRISQFFLDFENQEVSIHEIKLYSDWCIPRSTILDVSFAILQFSTALSYVASCDFKQLVYRYGVISKPVTNPSADWRGFFFARVVMSICALYRWWIITGDHFGDANIRDFHRLAKEIASPSGFRQRENRRIWLKFRNARIFERPFATFNCSKIQIRYF